MAERHQHFLFSGGYLLQTRGIKNLINKKPLQAAPPSPVHVTPPRVEPQITGGIRPMD